MHVDVQIYGVHDREHMITNLLNKLELDKSRVHYDDRPNGGLVIYTAKKAWLAPIPDGTTHRIALADDNDICENFVSIATLIAETHPNDIISFFPYEFMRRNEQIEGLDTPYFKSHSLFGSAIMMPVKYIEPCFEYIKKQFDDNVPDDDGIWAWAQKENIRILTTIPAMVQHIGDDSILEPGRSIRRTVYFDPKADANWKSKKVMQYCRQEWFFSNHGKPSQTKGVLLDVSER